MPDEPLPDDGTADVPPEDTEVTCTGGITIPPPGVTIG